RSQRRSRWCGEANDDQAADHGRRRVARQRSGPITQTLQPFLEIRPEVDERGDRGAVGQQCVAADVRKYVIGDSQALRPDESAVLLDPPAVDDLSADDGLAMRRSPQDD